MLTARQFVADLDRLGESAEYHILPTDSSFGASPFDFSRSSELLERSYRSTLQWVQDGGMNRGVVRAALRTLNHAARRAPMFAADESRGLRPPRFALAGQAFGAA
ncbi:MAG: hypothetical protein HC774_00895 [Sphingomonadales bacterium]|nr:hypothetical protein [Sphingomonadales bacterium]